MKLEAAPAPRTALTAALAAATALLGLLATPGCGRQEEAPAVVRPVRTQVVFASGGTRTRAFSGVSRSSAQVDLSFKVAGTLQRLPVKVGDDVRQGQLVAALDPRDYELQVEEARAGLVRARAEARNAQANYDRVRALYENRNASRTDLDQARTAFESSQAAVVSAEKRLELAERQLEYTRLLAPVAGRIAAVPVEPNENVTAGRTIAVLESGERPEVRVGIPEQLINAIRPGDAVTVRFDALPNLTFPATVTEVGVASLGSATFPVTVQCDTVHAAIRPGMAAEVRFTFRSETSAESVLVPPVAVGEDRDGRFVFVARPQHADTAVVERRAVQVGQLTTEGLEIRSGLRDGELLVTAGVHRIHDGQRVRLLDGVPRRPEDTP